MKLLLRGVVAVDVRLRGGEVLFDQSMRAGDLIPIEAAAGLRIDAGVLVRRGGRGRHRDERAHQVC